MNFVDFMTNPNIYETILDNVTDAICVVDVECRVVFWNKSAEVLHQIPRETIKGALLTVFFPNALLPRVLKEGRAFENVYNQPKPFAFNIINAHPLYQEGVIFGAISCDRDVSDFIEISKKLEMTETHLSVLKDEMDQLLDTKFSFDEILGSSLAIYEAVEMGKNIAKTDLSVLLTGESGTGKELFARAIHNASSRKGIFVAINCSAIPYELMESELFGYEDGAFTGAKKSGHIGKFELAHEGTLFLDEIGDMPLAMQAKLLRVIEDGFVTKIGSNKPIHVDVRIIAATNRHLAEAILKHQFRKDLYYRLNAIHIEIPPLRNRSEDVELLVREFTRTYCMKYRATLLDYSKEAMDYLSRYHWDGNVRELKNVIERLVILSKNQGFDQITPALLPQSILVQPVSQNQQEDHQFDITLRTAQNEAALIHDALVRSNWVCAKAAKLLKIPRSTLYFKMNKYAIEKTSRF
jgi:transcriptional regulator with PAS, ATPase and Fis domain